MLLPSLAGSESAMKRRLMIAASLLFVVLAMVLSWFSSFRFVWIFVSLFVFVSSLFTLHLWRRYSPAKLALLILVFFKISAISMTVYKSLVEDRFFFDWQNISPGRVETQLKVFQQKAAADDARIQRLLKEEGLKK